MRPPGESETSSIPGQAVQSPCAARNPIQLVDEFVERAAGRPQKRVLHFELPIAASVCVRVSDAASSPGLTLNHQTNVKELLLDGEVLVERSSLRATDFADAVELSSGTHELLVDLAGKPGTGLQVSVSVPGPVIDSFAPEVIAAGDPLVISGEGFLAPIAVSVGGLALNTSSASLMTIIASAAARMPLAPITVKTPFGSAVSAHSIVSSDPAGVVWTLDRFSYAETSSSAISSLQMVDDGRTFAAILRTSTAVEPTAAVDVELLSAVAPAPMSATLGPVSRCNSQGLCLAYGVNTVAVSGPLTLLGSHHPEGLGRAFLGFTLRQSSGSARFPSAGSRWANEYGYFDARPVVAPRYLRFYSTDGVQVAARHGATHLQVAEDGQLNLVRIRDDQSLEEALIDFAKDADAVGAFPDPMAYPTYVPTNEDGGSVVEGCGPSAAAFDTGQFSNRRPQRNLEMMRVKPAWENADAGFPQGQGVSIIINDTGVSGTHEETAANINFSLDRVLVAPGLTNNVASDVQGHGTSVASVAAGRGDNGGMAGVAPRATIVRYRGSYKAILGGLVASHTTGFSAGNAALTAMKDQVHDPSLRVINMSFAEPLFWYTIAPSIFGVLAGLPLQPAWIVAAVIVYESERTYVRDATKTFVVVASSGNYGDHPLLRNYGMTFPATVPGVLAVGGVNQSATDTDPIVPYPATQPAKFGEVVALSAPTNEIVAASFLAPTALRCFGGTSATAAEVSGAAAVLFSIAGNALTPAEVRQVLISTARPVQAPRELVGAGLVDLEVAVNTAADLRSAFYTFGARTTSAPIADTAFVGETAYYLSSDGRGIGSDPPAGGDLAPVSFGGLSLDWITGMSNSNGLDELWGGRLGASAIRRIRIGGSGVQLTGVILPGTVRAEPVRAQGTSAPAKGAPTSRWLFATSAGLVSVAPDSSSATLVLPRSDIFNVAVGNADLGARGHRRLALETRIGASGALLFLDYDVDGNTATVMQPGALPANTTVDSLVVMDNTLGTSAVNPVDKDQFPVWVATSSGGLYQFEPTVSQTEAISTRVGFEEGLRVFKGVLKNDAVPAVYAYAESGTLMRFDALSRAKQAEFLTTNAGSDVLGRPSYSSTARRMIFRNGRAFFNPDREDVPPWFFVADFRGL